MKIFIKNVRKKIKAFFLPSVLTCTMIYISSCDSSFSINLDGERDKTDNIKKIKFQSTHKIEKIKKIKFNKNHKKATIIDKVNKSYLELSQYGNFQNYSSSNLNTKYSSDLSLMFPLLESDNSVLFSDLKSYSMSKENIQNFSGGLGVRFIPEAKKDFIFGFNAYIDYLSTDIGKNFTQLGFGGEIIHNKFELRSNLYTNISEKYFKQIKSSIPKDLEAMGSRIENGEMFVKFNIPDGGGIYINEQRIFNEIDYEIGYNLNKNISIYGGGFFAWDHDSEQKFAGPKLKLKLSGKLNDKTEIYTKLETKTNTIDSLNSNAKTNFEISSHLRFELQNISEKQKLNQIKLKNKSYKKQIAKINQKQIEKKNLLKLPVLRRHHIETQNTSSAQNIDSELKVLAIGSHIFDYYVDVLSDSIDQNFIDSIKDKSLKPVFFFNLNEKQAKEIKIDSNLDFNFKPTIIGDTSICPDPSLCIPGTNLFNISTEIGNFKVKINSNGGSKQEFKIEDNVKLNFKHDVNLFGGNFEYTNNDPGNIIEIFGNGDSKISNISLSNNQINIKKTSGSFDLNNSNFKNSNLSISEKFDDQFGLEKQTLISKINIENNDFSIDQNDSKTILDLYDSPNQIDNFVIKNNSFRGENSDVKIRKNKNLNSAINFIKNNKIDGKSNLDELKENPLKNIEFIDPIIPPILNKSEIRESGQVAFPSIIVFDRKQGTIKKKSDSIETIFSNYNNNATTINSFQSKLIQIVGKNINNLTDSPINLSGNIDFQDGIMIFGRGSDDLSDLNDIKGNDSNFDVSYKIFSDQSNVSSDSIIDFQPSNEKLNFHKPKISVSNDLKIYFGNSNQMLGLDFNLTQSKQNVFMIKEGQENFESEKNNFLNWSGLGSKDLRVGLFEIFDNSTDTSGALPKKNAGHKFNFNRFTISENAKYSDVLSIYEKSDYDFTASGSQFKESIHITNNYFEMGKIASENFNNFIYITPDKLQNQNDKNRVISFDIKRALKYFYKSDDNQNIFKINNNSIETKSSKILDVFSRNIIDYLEARPFSAYFQFDPLTNDNKIIFNNLNKDKITNEYSIEDIVSKDHDAGTNNIYSIRTVSGTFNLQPNPNISFGINNRWETSAVGSNQEVKFGSTGKSVEQFPNAINQANQEFLNYVTNARFSDWKDFDRLIQIDLEENTSLNECIKNARAKYSSDLNKKYLFLINDPKKNININLLPEARDSSGNIINEFLREDEYLVGPNYKFWVSAPNESYDLADLSGRTMLLTDHVLNDIINLENDDFDQNKLKIQAKAKSIENKGGFENIYEFKKNTGIIGLNFDLYVENENDLLDYPRGYEIESELPIQEEYYFANKKNNFFYIQNNGSNQTSNDNKNKNIIQDNIFNLRIGDSKKDYINIFNFRNDSANGIDGQSFTLNNYHYLPKYRIYNNQFNFEKTNARVINSRQSYVFPAKNEIKYKNESSNIDLLNIQTISLGGFTTNISNKQYGIFRDVINAVRIPHNNYFIENNSNNNSETDELKGKNISLISFENPKTNLDTSFFNNLDHSFLNGEKLNITDEKYALEIFSFPTDLNNQNIAAKKIHVFINSIDSKKNIASKQTISLLNSGLNVARDDLVLVSTNNLQPELSISFTNQNMNNAFKEFPMRFIFHNIDNKINLANSDNFQSDELGFSLQNNNNGIVKLGKNNIFSGIDFVGLKTYKFNKDCDPAGTIDNLAFQTTCSNCLNPNNECIAGSSSLGCPTCTPEKFKIKADKSGTNFDAFVFKFQDNDNSSKIINSNIDLLLENSGPSENIELTNHPENIIQSSILNNENLNKFELTIKDSKLNLQKYNFSNLVKINNNEQNIEEKINQASRNSIIILDDNVKLNHNSKIDLKGKALIANSAIMNLNLIGDDKFIENNREDLKKSKAKILENSLKSKILIGDEKNSKDVIFLKEPIFEIDHDTIISGLDFKINASSLDSSDENVSLFKLKSNIRNNNSNLRIIDNNFDLNLSGGIKLFDSKIINPESFKKNKFHGDLKENAFFFTYDPLKIDEIEEKYMDLNLLNKNSIKNCSLKIKQDDLFQNHDQINIGFIFDDLEYNSLKKLDSENFVSDSKKTLFFSKENLILKNPSIDLGSNFNGIISGANESLLNLKIKPIKSLSSNKLNLEIELKPGEINLISEENKPIVKGENYNLYNLNFEVYNHNNLNNENFILDGSPQKLKNNIFNIKNNSPENQIEKIIKDNFGEFKNSKILKNPNLERNFKENYLILK